MKQNEKSNIIIYSISNNLFETYYTKFMINLQEKYYIKLNLLLIITADVHILIIFFVCFLFF